MDEDSDVDKELDSSLLLDNSSLLDLHHGLDSSMDDNTSVFEKEEFMALKSAQQQMDEPAPDPIAMLQEMVQEMKIGFQQAVEELGKIQAKEENEAAGAKKFKKQQEHLDNLTETLTEIKNQLSVLTKDMDHIKDEQRVIKEQLEEVMSNRGSSQDRRSHSDSEIRQILPITDQDLPPEEWNYKIPDLVEETEQIQNNSNETRITGSDSELTSVACKSLSLTQALAEKCLKIESSDEDDRVASRRVSHYTPKSSQLLSQEGHNRRHSLPAHTPQGSTRDMLNAVRRQKIVKELADSERDYCSNLWSLINTYLTPLQSGGFFSSRELDVLIPPYIEQLYAEHCLICTGLQERLVHWTHLSTIADLITHVTDTYSHDSILPLYQDYAEDLPTAITCLKRALYQSNEFKHFLQAIKHSSCESEDLISLIMAPVQHMPKFLLQLQQVVRHTPPTHMDYPLLQTSLHRLQGFVDQLNKNVSSAMQFLNQANSSRSSLNEAQVSHLSTADNISHLTTSEEDNITSARALFQSSHSQSDWLDNGFGHRSLQQENISQHLVRPLSAHTSAISQPDLTRISQEVANLDHFPRSQSTLPSSGVADGLTERQYRHYKIKKLHKSPGRTNSQDYIHATHASRARPSSAVDFVGHNSQLYNHLIKRDMSAHARLFQYPGPFPRPHSAVGPPDSQHKPVIISRKHMRRSQPQSGSRSYWPETPPVNHTSLLAYPRMAEDDNDDDTRHSDSHSLSTNGSNPHSGSSNDPDFDGQLSNLNVSHSRGNHQTKPPEFTAAEVTASLAKKLYTGHPKVSNGDTDKTPDNSLHNLDPKAVISGEQPSPNNHHPSNPFKDNFISLTMKPAATEPSTNDLEISNILMNAENTCESLSPNPFVRSTVKPNKDIANDSKSIGTVQIGNGGFRTSVAEEVQIESRKQIKPADNFQLSEKNKQFLLSLASMSSGDGGHLKNSFRSRVAEEQHKTTGTEKFQTDIVPPPKTIKIVNGSFETTFPRTSIDGEPVEPAGTANGHPQVISGNLNAADSKMMVAKDYNSSALTKGNPTNASATMNHKTYTSPLDPFSLSRVTFFSADIQPTVNPTNPFITSSTISSKPQTPQTFERNAHTHYLDKDVPSNLRESHLNNNGDLELSKDARKTENGEKQRESSKTVQTQENYRTSDDPLATRKKTHFKASLKNLFSKKKGKIILADVEREVVMEMASASMSANIQFKPKLEVSKCNDVVNNKDESSNISKPSKKFSSPLDVSVEKKSKDVLEHPQLSSSALDNEFNGKTPEATSEFIVDDGFSKESHRTVECKTASTMTNLVKPIKKGHQDVAGQSQVHQSKLKDKSEQLQSGAGDAGIKPPTSEPGTLLIRKFDNDQKLVAAQVNGAKEGKISQKSLCPKCKQCEHGQNLTIKQNMNKSASNNHLKPSKSNLDTSYVKTVDDLNCTECLKPCSNAIKTFQQRLNLAAEVKRDSELESFNSEIYLKSFSSHQSSVVDSPTVDQISNLNKLQAQSEDAANQTTNKKERTSLPRSSENKLSKSFFKLFPQTVPVKSIATCSNDSTATEPKDLKTSRKSPVAQATEKNPVKKKPKSQQSQPKKEDEASLHEVTNTKTISIDRSPQNDVTKSESTDLPDTTRQYVLKGKEFDHHYRLYYDEETVGNGQSPPEKSKHPEPHLYPKKDVYRQYLRSKIASDASKQNHREKGSHFQYKDYPQENRNDVSCQMPLRVKSEGVRPKQKIIDADKGNFPNRDSVHQTSAKSVSSPLFQQQGKVLMDLAGNQRIMDMTSDMSTCAIDGQKHSTGIPVMPIILPVVGTQNGHKFSLWSRHYPVDPAVTEQRCALAADMSQEMSRLEETAVKQDVSISACSTAYDESNSYKPRKCQAMAASAGESKGEMESQQADSRDLEAGSDNNEPGRHETSIILAKSSELRVSPNPDTANNNLSSPAMLGHCTSFVIQMEGIKSIEENRESLSALCDIPDKKSLTNSSPCQLLNNAHYNQYDVSNIHSYNHFIVSDHTPSPLNGLTASKSEDKMKSERRSKNKVMVNIGNPDNCTTLMENGHSQTIEQDQRTYLDGVVMRSSDHRVSHCRTSNAELSRRTHHNIPPHQMTRPVSHPHWSILCDSNSGRNELSIRNSYFGDPVRSSSTSYNNARIESFHRNHFNKSPCHNSIDDQVTQATPDLVPLNNKQKDEPDKAVKQNQSLFSRLTQTSLSFFSRESKPNNTPKK